MGDAGVGKTVIAAALAKRTRADGRLGACYFCCYNDSTRNNPRNLIGTVAYQLCKYNKEYSTKVGGQNRVTTILANSTLRFNELFTKLLHEPLGKCNTCSQRMLVIIDALDETIYKSREDFLELLKVRFPLLPKWLVFFITSRPEDTVQFYLKRYKPCIKICAGNDQDVDDYRQHEADIRRFLKKKVNFSELPYSVEDVVAKCNGLFLYAYYISQVLSDRTSAIKGVDLTDHFPGDIESFFLTNFKRVFDKLSEAGLYWKLFGCVIAAPAPLPLSFISFIIKKEKSNLDVQTVIDAVSQFVVFRTSDKTFLFLHNLIPSWLTNEEKARKLFIDRGRAGEYFKEIIVTFLDSALSDQTEGGLSINSKVLHYLLHVGVRFLCCNYDNRDTMTTVFRCLTSFHLLQKRVDIDRLEIFSAVSDYKLCLACHYLADADKEILQEICTALEENIHVLVECPHLLPSCLQCTSEATQKKFAVDTLMTCKSVHRFSYVAPTVSCENSYFVVYVQRGGRGFQALSLQTGAILSCVSGFNRVFHIRTQQSGIVFSAGSEESIVLLSDFPVSSSLGKYLKIPQLSSNWSPSGVTFTLEGNILSLFSNLMLCELIRNGDGSFATNCTPLTFDREVAPLSCVENCALSRQGNSIAISQKASIFIFCDRKFHCTVFEESEDIWCQVSCLMFSHDSTLLLYCVERGNSKAEVCLWNVLQKKASVCFFASTLVFTNCCCFSSDNSIVILCGEFRFEVWEDVLCSRRCLRMVKEMNEIGPYQTNDRFHYCSLSSRNELLAFCIADDVVLCSLCSPAKESFCRLPRAHLGQIQFCQFFRETRYLISYGIDGAVFLWDLYEGKAAAFARVAEREESIEGMSVSSMEDEVVCSLSSGRVITIELHGLKSATEPSQMLSLDATESSLILGLGYLAQGSAIEKFQSRPRSRKEFVDESDSDELIEDMDIFMPSDRSGDESDDEETQK